MSTEETTSIEFAEGASVRRIFVSYRRADGYEAARSIYHWLLHHHVPDRAMFFDQRAIPPGARFPIEIRQGIVDADVVLVIIGRAWVSQRSPGLLRKRRLFERRDWVRAEIELALGIGKPIVPLLIDGAQMPLRTQLPESLQPLCECEAYTVAFSNDIRFEEDMLRLAQSIAHHSATLRWNGSSFVDFGGGRQQFLEATVRRFGEMPLPMSTVRSLSLDQVFQPLQMRHGPTLNVEIQTQDRWHRHNPPSYALSKVYRTSRRALRMPDGMKSEDANGYSATDMASQAVQMAANGAEALVRSHTRRMIALGGPGTGKTTLMYRFMRDAAELARVDANAPLPVYLLLPELARSGLWSKSQLPAYLRSELDGMNAPSEFAEFLADAIQTGHAILCLDGLDEVSSSLRPHIVRWIRNLPAPAGRGAIIVGSRFTNYQGNELTSSDFFEWELMPLDHDTRKQLAEVLFNNFSNVHQPSYQQTSQEDRWYPKAADAVTLLESRIDLTEWSENPLLFTLAVFVFIRRQSLPERRVDLYREVVQSLLMATEKRLTPVGFYTTLDVIAGIALDLFRHRGRTFTERDLVITLRQVCAQFSVTNEAIDNMYDRIVGCGLIDPLAQGSYAFRHMTFQEYLVAAALAYGLTEPSGTYRDGLFKLIRQEYGRPRWAEVLQLMVGILAQEYHSEGRRIAASWLEWLNERRNSSDGDPGYRAFTLALRSLVDLPTRTLSATSLRTHDMVGAWAQILLDAARQKRMALLVHLHSVATDIRDLPPSALQTAIDKLLKALDDPDWSVQSAASDALGQLGERAPVKRLVEALRNGTWTVRIAAARALGQLGERAPLEPLLEALVSEKATVRAAVVEALGQLRTHSPVERLVECLFEDVPLVRVAAVHALGHLGNEAPVDPLLQALGDEDWTVRAAVAEVLGRLRGRVPVHDLVSRLESGDSRQRAAAADALGRLGDPMAVQVLMSALSSPITEVAISSARALGRLGAATAVPMLIHMLDTGNARQRAAAVDALGQLGDPMAAQALERAANDDDWMVRVAVAAAIIGDNPNKYSSIAPLDEEKDETEAQTITPVSLAQHDQMSATYTSTLYIPSYLAYLDHLLKTGSSETRQGAAEALGKLHLPIPPDIVENLKRLRSDPNQPEELRQACEDALGEIMAADPIEG